MDTGCKVFALLCVLLLSSIVGQNVERSCFCSGIGRGCNFDKVLCSPLGHICEKENVALGKPTKYSSLYQSQLHLPKERNVAGCMANNGYITNNFIPIFTNPNLANCFQSGNNDLSPYWEVDLGRNYTITEISVYSQKQYNQRLLRAYISVDGVVGYRFPTATPDLIFDRNDIELIPPLRGTLVRLSKTPGTIDPNVALENQDYFLSFCELQVWVCRPGNHGKQCVAKCREACLGCDNNNGSCWDGCTTGFYGRHCYRRCGQCEETYCNQDDGECKSGRCKNGWFGPGCTKACDPGVFGTNCGSTCGICSEGTYCSSVLGKCVKRCDPGYKPPSCQEKCDAGTWGVNCSNTCGNCLDGKGCDPVTGECLNGCAAGWEPMNCTQACKPGTFGPSCQYACRNCKKGTICNIVSGECSEGCADGWMYAACDEPCGPTRFGPACRNTCGKCDGGLDCDKVTGACRLGCYDGWRSFFCNESCPFGTYGKLCRGRCTHCTQMQCNSETGECLIGCAKNVPGTDCEDDVIAKKETNDNAKYPVGLFIGIASGLLFLIGAMFAIKTFVGLRKKNKNVSTSRNASRETGKNWPQRQTGGKQSEQSKGMRKM